MRQVDTAIWFIIAGAIFSFVTLVSTSIKHLPLSTALVYLGTGCLLGPAGLALLDVQLPRDARWIEHATELAVLISLFSAGLHLRAPWRDPRWQWVLRLGVGVTMLTALSIAVAGVWLLDMSWGAALLLGGALAPTDPVLARDVQLAHPHDRSPLRFALTGEAGLNDGTAFPIVLLGLGLLHAPETRTGWEWLLRDVAWATGVGLLVGWILATLQGRFVLHLRRRHQQAVGLDHFLALGLIALSYGVAVAAGGYGFLAVFAAGLSLRRLELDELGEHPPAELTQVATAPSERTAVATDEQKAPVYLAQTALRFTELVEQIGEAFVMTLVGTMLRLEDWSVTTLLFLGLLFFAIRPAIVWIALAGSRADGSDRALIGWFGIRGVASVYYIAYAIAHGAPAAATDAVAGPVLATVAASTLMYGISVTPLMRLYNARAHTAWRQDARRIDGTR